MTFYLVDQLQLLQKNLLQDQPGKFDSNPRRSRSSVRLIAELLQSEINQKYTLGIYPRKRVLDSNFQQRLRQNGDINVINSKIIGMNYE